MRWALVCLLLLTTAALGQERVLVFAAASLKNALDEVNAAYGKPVAAFSGHTKHVLALAFSARHADRGSSLRQSRDPLG